MAKMGATQQEARAPAMEKIASPNASASPGKGADRLAARLQWLEL